VDKVSVVWYFGGWPFLKKARSESYRSTGETVEISLLRPAASGT
jgi:hypothetical protein